MEAPPDGEVGQSPVCESCGRVWPGEALPFRSCHFCGASPSWHHGRCCFRAPPNPDKVGEGGKSGVTITDKGEIIRSGRGGKGGKGGNGDKCKGVVKITDKGEITWGSKGKRGRAARMW